PLIVRGSLHVHGRHGVIEIELDVFFAAPNYFDRLVELLRKNGCFGGIVRFRFAAETSAEQRDVTDDVFLLNTDSCGYSVLYGLWILGAGPNGGLAVLYFGHGGGRFH